MLFAIQGAPDLDIYDIGHVVMSEGGLSLEKV